MNKIITNKSILLLSFFILTLGLSVFLTSCGAGGAAGGGGTGGTTAEICSGNTIGNGALALTPTALGDTDVTVALFGSFDRLDTGKIAAGMDWFYSDNGDFSSTSMGTQLISWWTEKGSRDTKLQVTNQSGSQPVSIHVQIFNENCLEVIDFCDQLTQFDTHVYSFSNLVTNTGSAISSSALNNQEGFVIITPNVNCGSDNRATSFGFLSGDTRIVDTSLGFQYGVKTWSRDADTLFSCTESLSDGNKVLTGTGDCRLNPVLPTQYSQVFSKSPNADESRADLVFITVSDNYSATSYLAAGGNVDINPVIYDLNEIVFSCASPDACYMRMGLNNAIKDSDDPLPPPASPCDATAPGAIIGTPGDDTLSGTPGADVIIGLGGNDTITGGGGADCIDGGPGNDIINAGSNNDRVYGGSGDDNIEGGGGDDEIHGNAGNDMLSGGNQGDTIFGEEGDDTLEGNGGPDTLDGGPGIDNLDGGGGTDTCTNGETLTSC